MQTIVLIGKFAIHRLYSKIEICLLMFPICRWKVEYRLRCDLLLLRKGNSMTCRVHMISTNEIEKGNTLMAFFGWRARRAVRTKTSALPPQAWAPTPPIAVAPQRRYLDGDYLLPKDEEETNRLNFQHHALHLTLGNHYLAPLPPVLRTIVDVGAGTGILAGEMARLFPESLVVGLDVDAASFGNAAPGNCLLRAGDVLKGLPLPDAFADFAHQRFLVLAIPDSRWPDAVRELVRVTRSGGWLELVETDARVQAGGPATERIFGWIEGVRQARGLLGKPVGRLGELLWQQGLQEVECQQIPLKIGAWGGRAGIMMEQDVLAAVQALKESCCAQGVDPYEFDAYAQTMAVEWQQAHAFCTVYAAYGRRAEG